MSENEEAEKEHNKDAPSESESDDLELITDDSTYRKEDSQRVQSIISTMNDEELQQYETFRRSGFPKAAIKKYINNVIGQAVNPNFVIAVSGLAKVFVGEVIEVAKAVQREQQETGPLMPSHIHEAYRRLYKRTPGIRVFKDTPWD